MGLGQQSYKVHMGLQLKQALTLINGRIHIRFDYEAVVCQAGFKIHLHHTSEIY